MNSKSPAAALLVALLAGCAANPVADRASPDTAVQADERHILVMIADPNAGRFELRGARSGAYRLPRRYPARTVKIVRVLNALASEYRLQPVQDWPMQSLGIHCAVFEPEAGASVDELIRQLGADSRVESVQRMQRFRLNASEASGRWNDPYHRLQRSLRELRITEAQHWSTGRGVHIAMIDTGVDASHPELKGQVVELKNFIGGGGTAAEGRHGTAVAGVIASHADNRLGIVGVAPDARLLALKACEERRAEGQGVCTSFSLARAIDYAIVAKSDVINLSLGGPHDRLLERLLLKAMEREAVVVAALGEGGSDASFPATLEGVVAVSVIDSQAQVPSLAAPGLDVLTLVSPDGYDFHSGSSIAAAHVSGIVALLLERAPALRGTEIRSLLARTSHHAGSGRSDRRGLVNACAALAEVVGDDVCDAHRAVTRATGDSPAVHRLETD